MATEKKFVAGMRFQDPRERAPKWIRGHISVKADEFAAFMEEHKDDRGWLNIDVKESKGGKLYCELNEWRPGPRKEAVPGREDLPPLDDEPPEGGDLPF